MKYVLVLFMLIATPILAEDKVTEEKTAEKKVAVKEVSIENSKEVLKYKLEAVELMNKKRALWNRPPVTISKELDKAANDHANWMALHWMSHTGVNGSRPYTRVKWAKYPGAFTGEIICVSGSKEGAINMWMGSPPHMSIMMNSGAKHVGIAYRTSASGQNYWVAVFGRPVAQSN